MGVIGVKLRDNWLWDLRDCLRVPDDVILPATIHKGRVVDGEQ